MRSTAKRVLFVAEAVTLAHVARATVLASTLHPIEFSPLIACDERYDFLFQGSPVPRHRLWSIPTVEFEHALARGRPLYRSDTLDRYVADDLALFAAISPDVVVGDFRLSLSVSAELAGIPYVNVSNAGWSPYAATRFPVPDLALTKAIGTPFAQWLFDRVRPSVFAAHARPLNDLRRKHGLHELPHDLRHVYTDGDRVLYADLPELISLDQPPPSHRFLGPVLWSPDLAEPPWASSVPTDRPLVYVNMGSSGRTGKLADVVRRLASLPVSVVAATADRVEDFSGRPNVFTSRFLSGERWSARAAAVVCNGGSPTAYQALSHGVPVIGLPGNLDQFVNMAAVVDAGAGALVRADRRAPEAVLDSVMAIVDRGQFRDASSRLRRAIASSDPASVLAETLRSVLRARH